MGRVLLRHSLLVAIFPLRGLQWMSRQGMARQALEGHRALQAKGEGMGHLLREPVGQDEQG